MSQVSAKAAAGVLTMAAADGTWTAWVGLSLRATRRDAALSGGVDQPDSRLNAGAFTQRQAWLAAQWTTGPVRFEVRYRNDPNPAARSTDGVEAGISCALLGQTHGVSQGAAISAALDLRERLARTPQDVRAEPMDDADTVHRTLVPLGPRPDGIAEVRKRLRWASCSRPGLTQRQFCVAVNPLNAASRSWEPVWTALAKLPAPTMVGICLEPYHVNDRLRARLRWLEEEYRRLGTGGSSPLFRHAPDAFAVQAWPFYRDAVARYTDRAFRLRITIASAAPLSDTFAHLVAATVSPAEPATPLGGGAAVCRPPLAESEAAWRRFAALDRDWLDATYRQGLPGTLREEERILTDLVDLPEAAAAFHLPCQRPQGRRRCDVGVITVLPVEMRAVLRRLSCLGQVSKRELPDGLRFHEATIADERGDQRVVATQATEPGQHAAILAVQHLRRHYDPTVIVLVGIAGGVHADVRVGDVVIADAVIYYDPRKETASATVHRGRAFPTPAPVLRAVNDFQVEADQALDLGAWSERSDRPAQVHTGPIGSGGAVIANQDSKTRAYLSEFNDKVLAVETEAGGVAQAFHETVNGTPSIRAWLVVRGISDLADQDKNDLGHDLAARAAAEVLARLLPYLRFGQFR